MTTEHRATNAAPQTLTLRVREARGQDVGRGIARVDPKDLEKLRAGVGDIVGLEGKRRTVAKLMPAFPEDRGHGIVQIDGLVRENAKVGLDEKIQIQKKDWKPAEKILLRPLTLTRGSGIEERYLGSLLTGLPLTEGDRIRARLIGTQTREFHVVSTFPKGVVVIEASTRVELEAREPTEAGETVKISYEDIGGLGPQIQRIREMIELPLRYPEVFERLGIEPPKGVLLHGPPGTGKTLIARAVANETEAYFTHISGPEIMGKFYGESEGRLRSVFEEAQKHAPAILFIDEIDAIAPKREEMGGERQVERRVVSQLLCIAPDTKIYTTEGPIPIKELYSRYAGRSFRKNGVEYTSPEDLWVYALDAHREISPCRVIMMNRLFVPDTYKVKLENGACVTVSAIQRFCTWRNNELTWTPITDLKLGDKVAVPARLPVAGRSLVVLDWMKHLNGERYTLKVTSDLYRALGRRYVSLRELRQYLKTGVLEEDGTLRRMILKLVRTHGGLAARKLFEVVSQKYHRSWVQRLLVELERIGSLSIARKGRAFKFVKDTRMIIEPNPWADVEGISVYGYPAVHRYIKDSYFVRVPCELSPELAELLGYVLADGSLSRRRLNISGKPEIVQRAYELIKSLFGFEGRLTKIHQRYWRFDADSSTLAALLSEMFEIPIGKKAYHVRAPNQLFVSPGECIAAFVKAYGDCDGSISTNLRIFSRSQGMMEDISALLLLLGFQSSLTSANGMHFCTVLGGLQAIIDYGESVGSARTERREQAVALLERRRVGTTVKHLPPLQEALTALRLGLRGRLADNDYRYLTGTRQINKEKLRYFLEMYEGEAISTTTALEQLLQAELSWVPILSVEKAEPMEMYDLTTEAENFVAGNNPLLLHNTLMDGLESRGQLVVIAATNVPNLLDPALRRPGRFDREISIPIPDSKARLEIFHIHTRGMPLAKDVDLEKIAAVTHGFVGADLEALAREAAMACLRKFLPSINFDLAEIPYETLMKLEVTQDHFLTALREVEPSAIREVFVETPDVTWGDVGGLEEIKEQLREAVEWPLQYEALFTQAKTRPPRGILLHGPPGSGKTLLAKALAHESQVNFISVKGPELMSKYVGESERGVREVFKKAKQAAPAILFLDEIDSLVPRRGSGGDSMVTERVISQFLTELDGLQELKGVLVLAATNRMDLVDPALLRPGRFDLILELSLPDLKARQAIFRVHLKRKPLSKEVDIHALAKETEGKSGADIENFCRQATMEAMRECIESHHGEPKKLTIQLRHFQWNPERAHG